MADFLYIIATHKKEYPQFRYIHIQSLSGAPLPTSEITQFTTFYFKIKELLVFNGIDNREIILFIKDPNALALNRYEKDLMENFQLGQARAQIRPMDDRGIDSLVSILEKQIKEYSPVLRTQLSRLRRSGNCIMILDDDQMVTRQLEKILSHSGFVISLNRSEDFLQKYEEYGPDILFLDIHLREAMGNELLKELKNRLDPYAHVVMISSDTEEKMVLDIKKSGAKGFIAKPFNQTNVYQHLLKSKTFFARSITTR